MKTMSTIGQSACMCLLHWNLICQTTWHWLHCCLPSSGMKPSSSSIKSTLGTPLLSLPLTRGASAILIWSFCIKYSRTIEEQPEERGLRMYSWYAGIGIWLELQVDASSGTWAWKRRADDSPGIYWWCWTAGVGAWTCCTWSVGAACMSWAMGDGICIRSGNNKSSNTISPKL